MNFLVNCSLICHRSGDFLPQKLIISLSQTADLRFRSCCANLKSLFIGRWLLAIWIEKRLELGKYLGFTARRIFFPRSFDCPIEQCHRPARVETLFRRQQVNWIVPVTPFAGPEIECDEFDVTASLDTIRSVNLIGQIIFQRRPSISTSSR